MRRVFLIALSALTLSLGASATTITLCNTGYGSPTCTGSPGSTGTADANYTLVANANNPGSTTAFIWNTPGSFPFPFWVGPDSVSAWIAPVATQGSTVAVGNYDYRLTFVTPAGGGTVSINGQWAVDDGGIIRLNGSAIGTPPPNDGSFTPFTINAFVPGTTNTLDFIVSNSPAGNPNPSGLRVEFSSANFTAAAIPEPATMAFMGLGLAAFALLRRRSQVR